MLRLRLLQLQRLLLTMMLLPLLLILILRWLRWLRWLRRRKVAVTLQPALRVKLTRRLRRGLRGRGAKVIREVGQSRCGR